jgi:hypothetical protein
MPCCSIFIFSVGIRLVLIFQPPCSRAYFSSLVGIAPDPFQAAAPQFCSASSCLDFRGLDFSVDLSSHLVFCFGSLLRDFSPSSVFVPVFSLRFPRLSLPVVFGRAAGEQLSNFCCCSLIRVRTGVFRRCRCTLRSPRAACSPAARFCCS